MSKYKGEAHFLRALYYFNLVRLFGDVPLIKTQQTAGDDLQVSRSPKEEVYELIIQDLKDAASMLPAQYELSSDIGRATKGASLGLLAKVYLTLKKYDDVISTIEEPGCAEYIYLEQKIRLEFRLPA
ncbi:RagB/SusD family nutrient uptake outer membrane protein [Bacteroides salyersiae]|nr:RagB/SusD family nutrient uptake outer membrane protein [Bacteroides salyersiae]